MSVLKEPGSETSSQKKDLRSFFIHLSIIHQPKGFSILEMVISVGVTAFVATTFASMYVHSVRNFRSVPLHSIAEQITYNTQTLLNSPAIWEKSLEDSSHDNFSCLGSTSLCQGRKPFNVVNIDGTIWIDSLDPVRGFSPSGNSCNSFSETSPDPSCPLRVEVYWEPVCQGADCIGSSVSQTKISYELKVSNRSSRSNSNIVFNPLYYHFTLYKPIAAPPPVGPLPPPPGPGRTFNGNYYIPRAAVTPNGQRFVVVSGIGGVFGLDDDRVQAHFFNEDFSFFNTVEVDSFNSCVSSGPVIRAEALDDSRFVLIWESGCGEMNRAQIFDQDGSPLSAVFTVCQGPAGTVCYDSYLAKYDSGNKFITAYNKVGSDYAFFRYFDNAGNPIGGEYSFLLPERGGIYAGLMGAVSTTGSWPVAVIYAGLGVSYRLLPPGPLGGPISQALPGLTVANWHDTDMITSSHDGSHIYIIDAPVNRSIVAFDPNFNQEGMMAFPTADTRVWPGVFPTAKAGFQGSALHSVSINGHLGAEPLPGKRVVTTSYNSGPTNLHISTAALTQPGLLNFKVIGGPTNAIITGLDATAGRRDLVIISQPYEP